MKPQNRLLRSIGVLAMLVTCAAIALGVTEIGTGHAQSQSASAANVAEYRIPTGNNPWGTAIGSDGNVWVAVTGCDPEPRCSGNAGPGKLEVFNAKNNTWLKTISLPHNYGQPLFVAIGKTGLVWFSMPMTNAIGVYNPVRNSFSQWGLPTSGAGPWGITIDKTGNVWVAEHYSYKVAVFNLVTYRFKEYATASTNSQPYGITVDGKNNVWFTENVDTVAKIGEVTANGHFFEYKIRSGSTAGTGLTPHMITVDQHGNPWWSEGWVSSIGTLNVAAAKPGTNRGVTEYKYNSSTSHASGIGIGPDGRTWFTDSILSEIGTFNGHSFSLSSRPSNSHPHDGLNVDPHSGSVFFTEQYANKLARTH